MKFLKCKNPKPWHTDLHSQKLMCMTTHFLPYTHIHKEEACRRGLCVAFFEVFAPLPLLSLRYPHALLIGTDLT